MRIMYIQPGELLGGAERQGIMYISRLRKLGFEVLPVIGPSDAISRALEREGVQDYVFLKDFFHLTTDRGHSPLGITYADLRSGIDLWRTLRRIDELARSHRTDVMVASRFFGWCVATPVARHLRLPIVWRAGGCITTKVEELGLRLFTRRFVPDALVCNSEAVRNALAPHIACPSQIIQNGIDTTRFDIQRTPPRLRTELGIAPATPVVAIVARPKPLKNFELLAKVLSRTAERIPSVRLLVAGDSASRSYYEQLYAKLGLGERTTFLGHRDDIENVHASCDVAVLTSHSEGSPNAIQEAMAMERPVVANGVTGLSELIQHGVNGFLAPPDAPETFSNYLIELLSNSALRAKMGAAGRASILLKYSDLASARKLAGLLSSMHGGALRSRNQNCEYGTGSRREVRRVGEAADRPTVRLGRL